MRLPTPNVSAEDFVFESDKNVTSDEVNKALKEASIGSMKININYWSHESAIIDDGATLGEGTKVWHFSHVCSGAVIGERCSLGQNVFVGNCVVIGNRCKIQNNVSVYEGVELEDYVFCGPSMVFTNVKLPRSEFPQRGSGFYKKTIVKKSASIGANATIICGVTIGRYSLIGSGSVVTKDVPDYTMVVGNPAQIICKVDKYGKRI